MNNNQITYRTLELLQAGLIIEAIKETQGWFNPDRSNSIFLLHDKLINFFFDRAFQKLPIHYRKKLISKFNHKTHFTNGVSKSEAVEYYYICLDAYEDKGKIKGLGGTVNMTIEMRAYYHAIDETVIEIGENKSLLKDLIYEVAKPLSNIFYERLELICKELSLSCEVKDEVYVAAPIPYKEYKFGNHTTVKCFEPDIAFGMVVIGVGDCLKPIDEYISDIRKFIDAAKRLVKDDEEKPTMIKLRISGIKWSNDATLTKDLPNTVDIEVDEDCLESAKAEGNLSDFLKFEISEDFVFTPIRLRRYKIL